MHTVVVERPRAGRSWAGRFPRPKIPFDDLPIFEDIKRPHTHRKHFTDLLGPLRRWLQAQLGRPWSDVYSEACAVIKPDSVVRAHIKTHLLELVQRHTFVRDSRIWYFTNRWRWEELPVEEAASPWSPFYVHPLTGLLCRAPDRPRRRWRNPAAERRAAVQRWIDDATVLRRLDGCWFECRMAGFPKAFAKDESPWRYDMAERKLICGSQARAIYGREVFCVAKRQLSRRELLERGLRNGNHGDDRSRRSTVASSSSSNPFMIA